MLEQQSSMFIAGQAMTTSELHESVRLSGASTQAYALLHKTEGVVMGDMLDLAFDILYAEVGL